MMLCSPPGVESTFCFFIALVAPTSGYLGGPICILRSMISRIHSVPFPRCMPSIFYRALPLCSALPQPADFYLSEASSRALVMFMPALLVLLSCCNVLPANCRSPMCPVSSSLDRCVYLFWMKMRPEKGTIGMHSVLSVFAAGVFLSFILPFWSLYVPVPAWDAARLLVCTIVLLFDLLVRYFEICIGRCERGFHRNPTAISISDTPSRCT